MEVGRAMRGLAQPVLLVGCPVRDRAWIIADWFRHLAATGAARNAGCTLGGDGRTVSKHVMERRRQGQIDDRYGY